MVIVAVNDGCYGYSYWCYGAWSLWMVIANVGCAGGCGCDGCAGSCGCAGCAGSCGCGGCGASV